MMKKSKRKKLKEFVNVYQSDDGTSFYHDYDTTAGKLYVKWKRKHVYANLPNIRIRDLCIHDNEVYVYCTRDNEHREVC
ncbi:hypothetical protein PENTCL1PPCAC_24510 [Pristionchus entomophagus]|uniref:Uncharacterized protein n=1 Tax=Pristionchus entomophagus TaxID=358040 RepID=A0AAV5U626_9BILA|nr:hypothetical protein PENTCL1PPCAC_24510 [Pristionchus entomophagus]